MQFWNADNRLSTFGRAAHASTVVLTTALLLVGASAPSPGLPTTVGDHGRNTDLRFGPCADVTGTDDGAAQGLECGTLDVPLSVDDPGTGTVHLVVSRLRATNPSLRRGVLVVNPGGPGGTGGTGGTGLEYAATKGAMLPGQVRNAYDIIGFEPRGIGHSE